MQRIAAVAHGRTDGGLLLTVSRPVFPVAVTEISVAVTGFSVSRPVFTATDPAPTHSSGRIPIIIRMCPLPPGRPLASADKELCHRPVTALQTFRHILSLLLHRPDNRFSKLLLWPTSRESIFPSGKGKADDDNRPRAGPARNEKTPRLSRPLWTAQPSVLAKAPFLVKGAGLVFHAVGKK